MIAAGKGSIINFGSISWMIMVPNLAAYTASKAAMHGMSRSLATRTRAARHPRQHAGARLDHDRAAAHPLGRRGGEQADRAQQALKGRLYPADIARMALFLAADDSKMISGQDFVVDGGWAHG